MYWGVERRGGVKMARSGVPIGSVVRNQAEAVGLLEEYIQLREELKRSGMSARESIERSYRELGIGEEYQRIVDGGVMEEVSVGSERAGADELEIVETMPGRRSVVVTRGAEVGEEEMTLVEQIRWVKHQLAVVRNGGAVPEYFPSKDVLFWYQIGVKRESDFDKIVIRMESEGGGEEEDRLRRDSEEQFKRLERQIEDACEEVEREMKEMGSVEV
jgi:hypothetical protein